MKILSDQERQTLCCDICGNQLRSEKGLRIHYSTVHKSAEVVEDPSLPEGKPVEVSVKETKKQQSKQEEITPSVLGIKEILVWSKVSLSGPHYRLKNDGALEVQQADCTGVVTNRWLDNTSYYLMIQCEDSGAIWVVQELIVLHNLVGTGNNLGSAKLIELGAKDIPPGYVAVTEEPPVVQNGLVAQVGQQEPSGHQEPVVQEPVVQEPVVQEPVVQEPVVQEPVVQEPVVQEPPVEVPFEKTELTPIIILGETPTTVSDSVYIVSEVVDPEEELRKQEFLQKLHTYVCARDAKAEAEKLYKAVDAEVRPGIISYLDEFGKTPEGELSKRFEGEGFKVVWSCSSPNPVVKRDEQAIINFLVGSPYAACLKYAVDLEKWEALKATGVLTQEFIDSVEKVEQPKPIRKLFVDKE